MKKQAFNPYLPSWEYIPDGEPYVFGDRVYVYGSHDYFNGHVFCMGDYVCWSAPIDDLGNWRYEGVIYPATSDPYNPDRSMCLYAPDVTVGPDGRYYLYYVLDKVSNVSVAVCDTPAGKYEFLGYVHYADGTLLGSRPGDEPQFDPGVITENGKTYMYTGFCGRGDKSRHGSMLTVLDSDMLTIIEDPVIVVPGSSYSAGTSFENHAFFEASSIRKIGDTYYFIYSSEVMHELCYATSNDPRGPFTYGGVLVSNGDIGLANGKPANMSVGQIGNNHGSMVEINGEWYIFYHRQTNGSWFSRQGCAEKLTVEADGSIKQVEMTSCGLNGGPLEGRGEHPAYLACNLFMVDDNGMPMRGNAPKITQDGRDGDEETGYIGNVNRGMVAGFKYFKCEGIKEVSITTRAYIHGEFEIKTALDAEPLATIRVQGTNIWTKYTAPIDLPDGVYAFFIHFKGTGGGHLKSFELN
ncbi:MAG: family 43 glycosylhydrolase [Oscillospiraceae bacterium]|nr:family 43 glycosylhydrolase [Oscillospiraceae bacterium]